MNKVKIIQKTSVATIIMLFNQSTVYASDYSECIIEYSINSSVKIKNKEEFDNCLKSLKGKNIEAVVAIGGATPSGSLKRNKQLADERLKTTINYISNNFQNVRIKTYNVGVNDTIGKKVYLSFIMNDENNIESTGYFKNKMKQAGGKKHKSKKDKKKSKDSDSSDISDSSDSYDFYKRALTYLPETQPIYYWWYDPYVYRMDSVYIPTFYSYFTPYIELSLNL
jgi:hypothetical protein